MRPADVPLDHVTVTVADLERSRRFYDAALAPLGLLRSVDYADPEDEDEVGVEAVGYSAGEDRVVLWLVAGPAATANVHLAFRARDAAGVTGFFTAATAAGATVLRRPRSWALYRPGPAFSAMVGDPDGNVIEARADQSPSTPSPSASVTSPSPPTTST